MKNINKYYLVIIFILLNSCSTVNEISTYNDLKKSQNNRLILITTDSTIYRFDDYNFTDSLIYIFNGKKEKSNVQTNFTGNIPFKDIVSINYYKTDFIWTVLYVTTLGYVVLTGAPLLDGITESHTDVHIIHPGAGGGSGSCPYIYSWNGNNFSLEGEAFGRALGKSLEAQSAVVLNSLDLSNNVIKLKITNERPETHFFNRISLLATESNPNETVYSDNYNQLWAVKKHKAIYAAFDRKKNDITGLLSEDDIYWKSDLSSANMDSDFEDIIEIELKEISEVDSIALIISAINTDISTVVFRYLQRLLGDEFANFTKAAETDLELIEILKTTLKRSALKIDIWNGNKWEYCDMVYPEASKVEFRRLIRLPRICYQGSEMKLRLRCLTDVWRINSIYYDDTKPVRFNTKPVELVSFNSDGVGDSNSILEKDNKYLKLLPGESITLEYKTTKANKKKKIDYVLIADGYLYEWIIERGQEVGKSLANLSISTPKLTFVKQALKELNLVLPIIYSEWKQSRLNVL